MNVRCKFWVSEVLDLGYKATTILPDGSKVESEKSAQQVRLQAVCGGNGASEEDKSFSAYTPSGELSFRVDNAAVVGSFKPGAFYYLDLVPATDAN